MIKDECTKRAVRTFFQAFVGFMLVTIGSGEYNIAEWKSWAVSVGASAISAGISAVMNMKKKEDK